MIDGQNGMTEKHFWSRVTHHSLDLFPPFLPVAVDRTFVTNGLVLRKWTALEPGKYVLTEFVTLDAGRAACGPVMSATIDADHFQRCLSLKVEASFALHGETLYHKHRIWLNICSA